MVEGDYQVAGVPGTGARIELDFCDSGGAATGKILPTGNAKDTIKIDGIGDLGVSIMDVGNPIVFVTASSIGLKGTESPNEIKLARQIERPGKNSFVRSSKTWICR